jgi:abequosyltransferase
VTVAPLLSFAIPTYNRLPCLRTLIEALAAEVEASNGEVEVLVSDNGSTDGTSEWLQPLAERGLLRLVRHERNLGADANMVTCMRESRGRHVWIYGDDDLPRSGVLARVTAFLRERECALLYLPPEWHDEDLATVARTAPGPAQPVRVGAMELALRANYCIAFISSWVIHRERFMADPASNVERYKNTSLSPLEWHLAPLAQDRDLYSAPEPWILARGANTGGYEPFDTFVTHYHRILAEKLANRPQVRDFLQDHILRSFLPGLVWGIRIGAAGRLQAGNWPRVHALIERVWPERRWRRTWIRQITDLPRPLAKLVMGLCWLDSRTWVALKVARNSDHSR